MRTTIDIPEDLMKEAMKVTNSSTKNELIKIALKDIIHKYKIKSLKKYKGKIDLSINLNDVRSRSDNTN